MIKAQIKIKHGEDRWWIESYYILIDLGVGNLQTGGEYYTTRSDAVAWAKRRVMDYLKEMGRTETEEQVHWSIK
jgi:hypothetical protein